MLRAEVLRMYRQVFRAARKISVQNDRQQIIDWTRKEFRDNKDLTDVVSRLITTISNRYACIIIYNINSQESIRSRLKYATTLLNELQQSLELSQTRDS